MRCDRCVEHFDHHCKWLNNCIGASNYRCFRLLLALFAVCTLLQTVFSIVGIVSVQRHWSDIDSLLTLQRELTVSVLLLHLTLTTVILLPLTHLIILHIWLAHKGITTFEWIKSRKKTVGQRQLDLPSQMAETSMNVTEIASKVVPEASPDCKASETDRCCLAQGPPIKSVGNE